MLQAFTRNYQDNSTDAGHQFTFFCDNCNYGFKSGFIESDLYKKKKSSRMLGHGASLAGSLLGEKLRDAGYSAERGSSTSHQRVEDNSAEWQKEREKAFERCQNEAQQHFRRCSSCNKYVCDQCWNEDEGLCISCGEYGNKCYNSRGAGEGV